MQGKTLIVGIGNTILGDDGVGIYVARKLKDDLGRSDAIDITEASVGGLAFLDLIAGYQKLVIVDAIITKQNRAGTLYRLSLEDLGDIVEPYMLHSIDVRSAVELGKMVGYNIPERITIYAVEIEENTAFREGLTPEIEKAVPLAATHILNDLSCRHA